MRCQQDGLPVRALHGAAAFGDGQFFEIPLGSIIHEFAGCGVIEPFSVYPSSCGLLFKKPGFMRFGGRARLAFLFLSVPLRLEINI
jgi:hypothetical protein